MCATDKRQRSGLCISGLGERTNERWGEVVSLSSPTNRDTSGERFGYDTIGDRAFGDWDVRGGRGGCQTIWVGDNSGKHEMGLDSGGVSSVQKGFREFHGRSFSGLVRADVGVTLSAIPRVLHSEAICKT